MERQEYENVRKYLNGEKIQEDEITRTKKQTKGIEIKTDVLYKRRDGKLVKILREDERDSVMFMIHNHETGAHFGVETTYKVREIIYQEVICRNGCQRVILSDRGTHFRNELVDGLCEKFEIKHKLSSPYHPQTNGLVERFNRTLCEGLAKVTEKENEWDKYIESVLFAYRTNKHNTTKKTPFFMIYGREAILPIDDINEDKEILEEESLLKRIYEIINLKEDRSEVLDIIGKSQEKQKKIHDEK